jgi:hypothetical protein
MQSSSSFRARFVVAAFLAFAPASLPARLAQASDEYPSVLQDELDMPCAPGCTLCHSTQIGQLGTAAGGTLFGKATAVGAGPKNPARLREFVGMLEAGNTDTDDDGKPDTTELAEGGDPSSKGDGRVCGPEYGCGARIAKAPPSNGLGFGLAALCAGAVALGFRRRR